MVPSKITISNTNPWLLSPHHRAAETGILEGRAPHTKTSGRSCHVLWTAMQQLCVDECIHTWEKTQSAIWPCLFAALCSESKSETRLLVVRINITIYIVLSGCHCTVFGVVMLLFSNSTIFSWANNLCDMRIVSRMILLWLLATCRFAYVLGEQPRNSAMLIFPYLVFFKRVVRRFAMNSWLESFLSVPQLTL